LGVKATGAKGDKGDAGEQGDKGDAGAQGEKGDKGDTGEAGADGKDGTTPQLKVGEDNYWYISYDNGATWTSLGVKATGEKGDKGDAGANGVGVAEAVIENGKLIVRLTDGRVIDCGQVVGADGVGIANVAFNEAGELLVTMTDGSVTNCGRLPVCEHSYSDWELVRAATCTSIGYSVRTCSKCKNVEYNFIEEAEHTFGGWLDMISSCTERWQVRICAVCGAAQVKTADPVGHRFTGTGKLCAVCGKVYETPSDLNGLDIFNGTYGYEYLGTMDKGEARQALYEAIDKEVRIFHVNTSLDAKNLTVATLDFSQLGLTSDEAVSVWKTYKDDNPLYYWLANTVTCTEGELTLLTENEYAVGTERGKYNALIVDQIEKYSSRVSASDSVYRTALAYHDFIIEAIDYAYGDDEKPETAAWAHNILGVFNGSGAVCEGYARSFQILLNYSGVENLFVTGTADGEAHAWNLIRSDDGNWYWCDLTWDDSFVGGLGTGNWKWGIAYNYFCVNDNTNTLWSEGGWKYDNTKAFLDTHTFDTSAGVGASFLYDLPVRSAEEFSDPTQAILNTTFRMNNRDFTVVGYDAVELNYITGSGHTEIPETITYNGIVYTVISLGSASANTILSPGITFVRVPKTVKFIWDFAFRQADLENIEVDEENPWFCSQDGVLFTKSLYTLISYPGANTRTEYTIPDETKDVAYWSFSGCAYLETLTLGANVSCIGIANWGSGYHNVAPSGGLYGNVVLEGIDRIVDSLTGNKVILVDKNNKAYTRDEVAIYTYDKSEIYYIFDKEITSYCIPANLASLKSPSNNLIFSDCKKLESFTVEEGNPWFSAYGGVLYNKEMTELIAVPLAIKGGITLWEGVTTIRSFAFSGCKGLTSITIPQSVTSIGDNAFAGCYKLVEVINLSSLDITAGSADHGYVGYYAKHIITSEEDARLTTDENGFIFYDDGTDAYLVGYIGSETSLVLPEKSPSGKNYKINSYAFYGCVFLVSITISDGVTVIGNNAFEDCVNLRTVTFTEDSKCESIGEKAFFYCSFLMSITIPQNVTSIGDSAFAGCERLVEVINRSSLNITAGSVDYGNVGYYAKHISTSKEKTCLTTDENGYIFFEDGTHAYLVGYIGSETSLILPEKSSSGKNYEINSNAFYNCVSLVSITIPTGVTRIGAGAFNGCKRLINVVVSDSVTSIDDYAFAWCTSLVSITIPTGVVYIGSFAFVGCSGLTSITMPTGVVYIGSYAFEGCSGLTSITIPEGVTGISSGAFYGCTGLTSITIPKDITSIGIYAFESCTGLTIIDYKGAVEQWNAISKSEHWDNGTVDYTIRCTDGTISKK
ncbi:MAG TPA: hypothetical protein DDY70_06980, partial [Clostridiales bacterium]|nr:hypothetical protein [Clostridiales bacterium]